MRKYPRVKLNHNKTEGIWFGRDNARPLIDMQHRNDMKMLGIQICNKNCYEKDYTGK